MGKWQERRDVCRYHLHGIVSEAKGLGGKQQKSKNYACKDKGFGMLTKQLWLNYEWEKSSSKNLFCSLTDQNY